MPAPAPAERQAEEDEDGDDFTKKQLKVDKAEETKEAPKKEAKDELPGHHQPPPSFYRYLRIFPLVVCAALGLVILKGTREEKQAPVVVSATQFPQAHAPPTLNQASEPGGICKYMKLGHCDEAYAQRTQRSICKRWLAGWIKDFDSLIGLTHSNRPGVMSWLPLGWQLKEINEALLKHLTQNESIVEACGQDAVDRGLKRVERWANGGKLGVLVPMTNGLLCLDPTWLFNAVVKYISPWLSSAFVYIAVRPLKKQMVEAGWLQE